MNSREAAFKILYDVEQNGAYVNRALSDILRRGGLSPIDAGLCGELVMGVLKYKLTLDRIISEFSSVKLRKISTSVITLLRLGIYQIKFLDKIPPSAAVNESVKLAGKYAPRSRGFVNGVLRSAARGIDNVKFPDRSDAAEYFSVVYSYPRWMVERLILEYGEEECEKILEAANRKQPVFARMNTLKASAGECAAMIERDGIKTEKTELEYVRRLVGKVDITQAESYKNGYFTLQNINSAMAAEVLSPQPNEKIIDICAAPGGKTTHIAEKMQNRGEILAFDLHEHKIALIESAAKRLGVDIIKARAHDMTKEIQSLIGYADRVLLDAACSGLGVIHKKPDIKWTRTEQDVAALCELQAKLLSVCSRYVRRGGVLVYSTCTILKEENGEQIRKFLSSHKNFEIVYENSFFTYQNGGSGFYICKLIKNDD